MNITFEYLCEKVGRLVIENELLAKKLQEQEEEIARLNRLINDCPVQCGSKPVETAA